MINIVEQHIQEEEVDLHPQTYSDKPHTYEKNRSFISQALRFVLVGGFNTLLDLAILNVLLWLFPVSSTFWLLVYSALAYSLGALNSFVLNKYWTFRQRHKTTRQEVTRFLLTTLAGMGWSTLILWFASTVLHPVLGTTPLWATASKVIALGGTAFISFLGMRLWVFTHRKQSAMHTPTYTQKKGADFEPMDMLTSDTPFHIPEDTTPTTQSISVVLPAYNEEAVIALTLKEVLMTMNTLCKDFEVIVVNDGSHDHTGTILEAIAEVVPQVRIITHEQNQGYGATLADGFAAASKELTFFMDADGQFDIRDLSRLLTFIDEYDAVIGYRIDRQDTWMRKLNAWGWKQLIRLTLGVQVRDIDCAFKLLRTDLLHLYAPTTRGAMINAELLSKLKDAGYTWYEVGIPHHPRKGGRATGAKLSVIVRAFRELFLYTRTRRRERATGAPQSLTLSPQSQAQVQQPAHSTYRRENI